MSLSTNLTISQILFKQKMASSSYSKIPKFDVPTTTTSYQLVVHTSANTDSKIPLTSQIKLSKFSKLTNFKNQFSQFSVGPHFPPILKPIVTNVLPPEIINTVDILHI